MDELKLSESKQEEIFREASEREKSKGVKKQQDTMNYRYIKRATICWLRFFNLRRISIGNLNTLWARVSKQRHWDLLHLYIQQTVKKTNFKYCRKLGSKQKTTVEFALQYVNTPIGVSTYKITDKLPKQYEKLLPSKEDISKNIEKLFNGIYEK